MREAVRWGIIITLALIALILAITKERIEANTNRLDLIEEKLGIL